MCVVEPGCVPELDINLRKFRPSDECLIRVALQGVDGDESSSELISRFLDDASGVEGRAGIFEAGANDHARVETAVSAEPVSVCLGFASGFRDILCVVCGLIFGGCCASPHRSRRVDLSKERFFFSVLYSALGLFRVSCFIA